MGQTRAAYGSKTTCSQCSKPFIAYRRTAKYCSEICKQEAKRARSPKVVAAIGVDPRENLQERLHLAELEADIWRRVFHAAAELGITFRKPLNARLLDKEEMNRWTVKNARPLHFR